MTLDRGRAAMPLYMQIAAILTEEIENGSYATGTVIPSEKQLQEEYSVSRMTIRLAISELSNKGYVEKMRGIGTLVTYGKIEENLKKVISFSDEMKSHGITMKTGRCEIELIKADAFIADKLKIPADSRVFELIRVRYAKEQPIVYSKTYLPLGQLSRRPEQYTDSLYALLSEKYGVIVSRAKDVLEAALATEDIAGNLEITVGFPIFKRSRIAFNQNNAIVEFSICYYPGDRYKYSVNI